MPVVPFEAAFPKTHADSLKFLLDIVMEAFCQRASLKATQVDGGVGKDEAAGESLRSTCAASFNKRSCGVLPRTQNESQNPTHAWTKLALPKQ